MALPATHLRIAEGLADSFSIASKQQYLSGTLYPDSRWLTGVDRQSSHSQACSQSDFITDDFTLGWHIHCSSDLIQTALFYDHFPAIANLDADAQWLQLSVFKMLQDREDMMAFDLDTALSKLTHVRSPNGEDPQKVQEYLDLVRNTYHGKKRLDMEEYYNLWIGVGLAPEVAAAIMTETRRKAEDQKLIEQLKAICPKITTRLLDDRRSDI